MKKRDGGTRNGEGGSGGASESKKKRLGGKGLSLEAFVGANRVRPIVSASQIRKQREVYQNSKRVNKYRKTLKNLEKEGHEFRPHIPPTIDSEIAGQEFSHPGTEGPKEKPIPSRAPQSAADTTRSQPKDPKKQRQGRPAKPASHLERLREQYERKKREEEEVRKERKAMLEEQQVGREKSAKERKEVRNKFRKVTGKGQPVMKHRMENLLESIQRGMER